jgi:hypothetical protein
MPAYAELIHRIREYLEEKYSDRDREYGEYPRGNIEFPLDQIVGCEKEKHDSDQEASNCHFPVHYVYICHIKPLLLMRA